MKFHETKLNGLYLIEQEPRIDERGYFVRIFCEAEFKKAGIKDFKIVQGNQSLTKKKGTIRGMHFQKEPKAEDKFLQCLKGAIYDVVIDLRESSPTFGQWCANELSEANKRMLFIPKGFAHGFQALSDDCLIEYFMSEFYAPDHADGVRWDDPFFNITWPIAKPSVISDNDKKWPLMKK